jgi:hypothetical protein
MSRKPEAMTRDLADTVKAQIWDIICAHHGSDNGLLEALEPAIRDLIAQATAEALEAAASLFPDPLLDTPSDEAIKIRALIPADIAAKAKEREPSADLLRVLTRYEGAIQRDNDESDDASVTELETARADLMALLQQAKERDVWKRTAEQYEKYIISLGAGPAQAGGDLNKPQPSPEIAEHDAKIRREAYLRCAAARCVFCGHTESPVKKVNGVWVHYAEAVLPTPCDAAVFVEWANEPPSGGKADGGGA